MQLNAFFVRRTVKENRKSIGENYQCIIENWGKNENKINENNKENDRMKGFSDPNYRFTDKIKSPAREFFFGHKTFQKMIRHLNCLVAQENSSKTRYSYN